MKFSYILKLSNPLPQAIVIKDNFYYDTVCIDCGLRDARLLYRQKYEMPCMNENLYTVLEKSCFCSTFKITNIISMIQKRFVIAYYTQLRKTILDNKLINVPKYTYWIAIIKVSQQWFENIIFYLTSLEEKKK